MLIFELPAVVSVHASPDLVAIMDHRGCEIYANALHDRSFVSPCCSVAWPTAAEIIGRVVGVHDGDTITVLDASKTQHKMQFLMKR